MLQCEMCRHSQPLRIIDAEGNAIDGRGSMRLAIERAQQLANTKGETMRIRPCPYCSGRSSTTVYPVKASSTEHPWTVRVLYVETDLLPAFASTPGNEAPWEWAVFTVQATHKEDAEKKGHQALREFHGPRVSIFQTEATPDQPIGA